MSIVQKVHILNSSYLASLNAAWLAPLTRWLVWSPENWFLALFTKNCSFLFIFLSFKCIAYDFFSKMHLDCNIILTEQQHLKCKEDIWRHLLDPKISWSTIEILIEQTFFWYLFKIVYPFQWSFLFLHPKKPVRLDRTQPLIALDRVFFSSQMPKHNSSSGHWPTAPKRTQHVDHEQSTEAPPLWICSCVWRTIDSLAIIN